MSRPISKKAAIAGLAAAGVLGVGIAVPAIAFAEGAEPSPSASASPAAPAEKPDRQDWQQRREERKDALAEALAAELGVDKEKVAAALEKVHGQLRSEAKTRHDGWGRGDRDQKAGDQKTADQRAADRKAKLKERLDKAVADGKLTREQADAIVAAAEAGVLNGPGWSGRGPR